MKEPKLTSIEGSFILELVLLQAKRDLKVEIKADLEVMEECHSMVVVLKTQTTLQEDLDKAHQAKFILHTILTSQVISLNKMIPVLVNKKVVTGVLRNKQTFHHIQEALSTHHLSALSQ